LTSGSVDAFTGAPTKLGAARVSQATAVAEKQ
jgi:hypothetical protein